MAEGHDESSDSHAPTKLSEESGAIGDLLRAGKRERFNVPPGEFQHIVHKRAKRYDRWALGVALAAVLPIVGQFVWSEFERARFATISPEATHERRLATTKEPMTRPAVDVVEGSTSTERAEGSEVSARVAPLTANRRLKVEQTQMVASSASPRAEVSAGSAKPETKELRKGSPPAPLVAPTPAGPEVSEGVGSEQRVALAVTEPAPRSTEGTIAGAANPGLAKVGTTQAGAECEALAKAGRYAEAADCHGKSASLISGTMAEYALLEKARLELRALADPARALNTLKVYRTRFPSGSLGRQAAHLEERIKERSGALR